MANYSDIKARGKKSFANAASFPASGNTGEIIVNQATGTLHVWKGSKWDRVASGSDAGLNFTTEAQSSYVLASDGTATTVTVAASDPDGFPVTYGYDVVPANQSQATIVNNNDGTFTITPSTDSANAGNFTLRIKADDGRKVIRTTSTVYLAFATLTVSPAVNGNTTFTTGSVTGFAVGTAYTLSNNTGADFDLDFNLEGGAGGGRSSDGAGGLTTGRYTLAANSSINLLVGSKGSNGTDSRYGGSGGAGTGIYTGTYGSGEVPIMVAGGGGGSMNGGTQTGGGGGTTGGAGSDTSTNSNDTPAGGGTQIGAGAGAGGNRFNGNSGSGRNGGAAAVGASFGGYTNPNGPGGSGFGNGAVGCFYPSGGGAGGGGGGYYGGGGGAIVYFDGGSGGAGGSLYFDSNVVTNGSTTTSGGTANSSGSCTITFV